MARATKQPNSSSPVPQPDREERAFVPLDLWYQRRRYGYYPENAYAAIRAAIFLPLSKDPSSGPNRPTWRTIWADGSDLEGDWVIAKVIQLHHTVPASPPIIVPRSGLPVEDCDVSEHGHVPQVAQVMVPKGLGVPGYDGELPNPRLFQQVIGQVVLIKCDGVHREVYLLVSCRVGAHEGLGITRILEEKRPSLATSLQERWWEALLLFRIRFVRRMDQSRFYSHGPDALT
ncbi:hypothetical protein PGQ11_006213 [Apiospora arundinis]|uniref:Uncharacterized protein n=1 Tax=Apiospora arundinis TaxID=335852 RepID=A0ABR2IS09_9PEZI